MLEAIISGDACDLHVTYSPDADLEGVFEAFCLDTQEAITINGWMISEIQPL
jgi:hypothetical protein